MFGSRIWFCVFFDGIHATAGLAWVESWPLPFCRIQSFDSPSRHWLPIQSLRSGLRGPIMQQIVTPPSGVNGWSCNIPSGVSVGSRDIPSDVNVGKP